jgi:hypothetical protein
MIGVGEYLVLGVGVVAVFLLGLVSGLKIAKKRISS